MGTTEIKFAAEVIENLLFPGLSVVINAAAYSPDQKILIVKVTADCIPDKNSRLRYTKDELGNVTAEFK